MRPIVLASSSVYRRTLLSKLQVDFEWAAPNVDESPRAGEAPDAVALRLAGAKARALAGKFSDHLIIGSDQVAALGQISLGKPGNHETACEQLRAASGKTMVFYTGLHVLDSGANLSRAALDVCHVTFRTLDELTIERYLRVEKPFECAGSIKSEGLGIALIESIKGNDPNALIGLPLIDLTRLLREFGVGVP